MFLNFEENKIKKASYPDLICDQGFWAAASQSAEPFALLESESLSEGRQEGAFFLQKAP